MDTDNTSPHGPGPVEPDVRERLHQHVAAHGPGRRRRRLVVRRSLAATLVVVVVGSGVGLAQLSGDAAPRGTVSPIGSSTTGDTGTTSTYPHLATTTTIPGTGPTGTSSTTGTTGSGTTGSGTTGTGTTGSGTTPTTPPTTVPFTGNTLPEDNAPGTVPAGVDLEQLSCGKPGFCIATDGKPEVAVTHDDGYTWTVVPLAAVPDAIACGGGTSCVVSVTGVANGDNANGDELQITTDGGTTWTTAPIPGGYYRVESISCWDATDCLATMLPSGGIAAPPAVFATSDGGSTWAAKATLNVGTTILDCQSSTSCWVTGGGADQSGSGQSSALQMLHSSDGGATWTTPGPSLGGTADSILGLSCASAMDCVVSGVQPAGSSTAGVVWTTDDGGQSWSSRPLGNTLSAVGVSCVNGPDCWAIGMDPTPDPGMPPGTKSSVLLGTTDGGSSWYGIENTSPPYTAIECHGTDICVMVGGQNSNALNVPTIAQGGGY